MMRSAHPVRALAREVIAVEGSFAPAGSGTPTAVKGRGFSVARTGVGTFVVTFEDVYNDLVGVTTGVQMSAFGNSSVVAGPYDPVAKTLTLYTATAGTAADVSANANNRIHFSAQFSNTSVP